MSDLEGPRGNFHISMINVMNKLTWLDIEEILEMAMNLEKHSLR